jgi:hypothetical protein
MACVFQACLKNTGKYFLTQEWHSGTSQIHSAVKVDGLRFDNACLFYSTPNFDKPRVIINIWSHSRHSSELYIPTLHYPWMDYFAPFQAYFFLSECVESVAASTHRGSIIQTLNFEVQVQLIPHGPSNCLKQWLIGMWRPLLHCHNNHALCQSICWRKVSTRHLP